MKVRFALMGCGAVARKHAQAITYGIGEAEITAFCDPRVDRAAEYSAKFGGRAFSSIEQMMSVYGSQIDVVSVLTPSGFHCENVRIAAAMGKHVIVEKPMALNVADAMSMIDACRDAGVELFVVKQNRFNRPIQKLQKALEENRLGKLVLVTARVRWRRDDAYYARDAWRGTASLDGGVMENQASHHIDLVQWIGGEVQSVSCFKSRRLAKIETEDTAVATLRFASGAIGLIEATTAARPRDLEGSISVLGEGGTVEIGGFAANRLKNWEFVEPHEGDASVYELFGSNPEDQPFYAHLIYLKEVVNKLLGRQSASVSGEEGLKTVEILEAMRDSHGNQSISNLAGGRAWSSMQLGLDRPLAIGETH